MFPGLISLDRYADPLADVQAAEILADTAAWIGRD
jgi:hypothetical protein